MFSKRKMGFTLIEILATIVIIGILSATAYGTYNLVFDKSELSMGHNQASAIQDAVAKYVAENGGELPLEKPNADYIAHPAKVDLAKISKDLEGKPKGNFYIYGPEKGVYFDYPVDYIKSQYDKYPNKSLVVIPNESKIDTNKLLSSLITNGTLSSKAFTDYVLMGDGTVVQTLDREQVPSEPNITIIPSKSAPYTADDLISFSAVAFSPKGDVSDFTWSPPDATTPKKYAVGNHTIKATAKDKDGNIITGNLNITIGSAPANSGNRPPTISAITANPSKTTYTSDEQIALSATASDPDGNPVSVVWIGKSADNRYPRGINEVSVYAVDSHGAVSSKSSISLKITNGAPVINSVDYTPKPAYQFDNLSFKVSAKDLDGDLIHYEWQYDKNKNGVIDADESALTTLNGKYPIGTHNAAVRAVDSMGKASAWKSFSFTVTNRLPTLPNLKPTTSTPNPYSTGSYSTTPYRTTTNFNFDADGSEDYDGDAITYYWRKDGGSWTTTQPDGKYSIGSHTIDVKARDARGGESGVKTFTFTVINTEPSKPLFTIQSTKNTITNFNPNVTTASTDIDGHTFTYEWNLDSTGWTTTRPTQRLTSGSHTLQLRAKDQFGLYSPIDSETFTIAEAQVTYTYYFAEDGNRTKTGSYTVPYGDRFRIDSAVSNYNATVSTSKSGSAINITASNGDWSDRDSYWDPQYYNKPASKSVSQHLNSTFATNYYWSDSYGYAGNIPKSGSYSTSGLGPSSRTETDTRYDTFPSSIAYNSGGFSGTLSKSGSTYVYTGTYTSADTNINYGSNRSTKDCPASPWSGYSLTKCETWGAYVFKSGDTAWDLAMDFWGDHYKYSQLDADNDHLLSSYGNFYAIPIGTRVRVRLPANNLTTNYEWRGTYTRPASDTRKYAQNYSGTVYRPDDRTYTQTYAGTVYKGETVYHNYKWKYTITIKYTVY